MLDWRDIRRRRSHGRATPRRRRVILTIVLAGGVLLALGSLFRLLDSRPTAESPTGLRPSAGSANAITISSSVERGRPTYGYSVIPGGAWDAPGLTRALEGDPVVADHYRGVDPTTMRAETLTSDRLAYVSYRVDDRVYWTKRKLLIRSGETVLTNGQVEIRSRCGNCISLAPMLPTAEDEPDELEFDALTDEPLLVWRGWSPSGPPLAVSAPPGDLGSLFVPVIPFGLSLIHI